MRLRVASRNRTLQIFPIDPPFRYPIRWLESVSNAVTSAE